VVATPMLLEPAGILSQATRLASIGIVVRSFELAVNWRVLREGDLLGWGGVATSPYAFGRFLQRTQAYPYCLLVMLVRGSVAGWCIWASYGTPTMFALLALLLAAQIYHNQRFATIFAASDHLFLVCLCALLFGSIPGASRGLQVGCLAFIAFQALLAYVVAAKHKLAKPHWRDGSRLTQVFQESAFRFPPLGRFFGGRPVAARIATWSIIVLHLSFPLSLVLPTPVFWLILAGGVLFHGTLAFTAGLHGFFWSFLSTYPALYFFHSWLAAKLYGG
jgi:hypothetical protein